MSKRSSDEGCRDTLENDRKTSKKIKVDVDNDKVNGSAHHKSQSKPTVAPRIQSMSSGIRIKLGATKSETEIKPKVQVASIFQQESDDEPEEMPREAKMRMRNIGRDTPTSSGPNSFGKTKQGFCYTKRMFEKTLEEKMKQLSD